MLTRREITAIFFAASTAPVVTCAASASFRLWWVTSTVAYLAAFVVGAPLFAYLRHRRWALPARSLAAAAVAGLLAATSIVTLVFLAFPPHDFATDPGRVLSVVGIAAAWALGLALVAGVTLWLALPSA